MLEDIGYSDNWVIRASSRSAVMVDTVAPAVRSWIMAQVKSKGMKLRCVCGCCCTAWVIAIGCIARICARRPDLVFPSRKKIVFVNGCFWHHHRGCERVRIPATNREYWVAKLERNRDRDERNLGIAGRERMEGDDCVGMRVAGYGRGVQAAGGVLGSVALW